MVNGSTINNMEQENYKKLIKINMKESFLKEIYMEKEFYKKIMVKFILGNGNIIKSMEKEN